MHFPKNGNIVLAEEENTMAVGSARLDVSDINLTQQQISNFEEAASGYEINNYIDISLYNTVFKGKTPESWDIEVEDFQNEATVILKLEDGVNVDEVVIIHEKHDGTSEIIPGEYNADTNEFSFKNKSFSNYAIATKTITSNPQTGDSIMFYIYLLGLCIIGLVVVEIYTKKKKIN